MVEVAENIAELRADLYILEIRVISTKPTNQKFYIIRLDLIKSSEVRILALVSFAIHDNKVRQG
jgi:hypothetical protein